MFTKIFEFMADLPNHSDRVAAIGIGSLILVGLICLSRWFAEK